MSSVVVLSVVVLSVVVLSVVVLSVVVLSVVECGSVDGSVECGSVECGSVECGSVECGSVSCDVSSGCVQWVLGVVVSGGVSVKRCSSPVRVHPPPAGGRPEWEWFPKSPSLSLPPPSHQWRGPVLHSQRTQQCKRQSCLGNGGKEDDNAISIFSSLHQTMGAHTLGTLHTEHARTRFQRQQLPVWSRLHAVYNYLTSCALLICNRKREQGVKHFSVFTPG